MILTRLFLSAGSISPRQTMLVGMISQIFLGIATGYAPNYGLHIFFRAGVAATCSLMCIGIMIGNFRNMNLAKSISYAILAFSFRYLRRQVSSYWHLFIRAVLVDRSHTFAGCRQFLDQLEFHLCRDFTTNRCSDNSLQVDPRFAELAAEAWKGR